MRIEVLDHGYVKFIEAWGTGEAGYGDERPPLYLETPDNETGIIEAARQSTQGSFRGWDQDAKLLKYLFEHKHATPFEFAGMVIEVQAPIFVFREWHRHRTQSYNEMSARYSPLPDLYYLPDVENVKARMVAARTAQNRQAGGAANDSADAVQEQFELTVCGWVDAISAFYTAAEKAYKDGLALGIPKELARIAMPVGHYSRMRASANLRNWLAFLTLRTDPAAQWEIRQYANAVGQWVAEVFPQTWALFRSVVDQGTEQ